MNTSEFNNLTQIRIDDFVSDMVKHVKELVDCSEEYDDYNGKYIAVPPVFFISYKYGKDNGRFMYELMSKQRRAYIKNGDIDAAKRELRTKLIGTLTSKFGEYLSKYLTTIK